MGGEPGGESGKVQGQGDGRVAQPQEVQVHPWWGQGSGLWAIITFSREYNVKRGLVRAREYKRLHMAQFTGITAAHCRTHLS